MMRIWNPSHFLIGKVGRSNCPRWRGQDYQFEPNETKEVSDLCGRWLISAFGYYGLVSLPDRNIVTDKEEYDKSVETMREHGIQQLYKWAVRVIDQYRDEAKKCVDARERPPRPNEFVKAASKIHKLYHSEIMLSDPETIKEHELMREILGTVEHDSDKLLDRSLAKGIKEDDENARQYSNKNKPIVDKKPNVPTGEVTKTGTTHAELTSTKPKAKKPKRPAPQPKKPVSSPVESAMENMKYTPDFKDAAN